MTTLLQPQPDRGRRTGDASRAISAAAGTLTAREQEILQLLAEGFPAAAISRHLCISHATVRNHVQHLLAKLGLHSKTEAVAYAYRHHLIRFPD